MNAVSVYKSAEGEQQVMALYDAALSRWPVPYEPCTVATRYGSTFAIVSGDRENPPLVLLHGSCSNAVSWMGDVAEYSRQFRVYAVDIPGEPGKSAQTRPDWNSPACAEWMEDVLTELELSKASLLGISQGGWTALKFAVANPEKVEKLVLLAPGGIIPARISFLLRAMGLSLFGQRGANALNRITFGGQPVPEEAKQFMDVIMTNFKPRMGNLPLFSDEELRCLTMPVLLIAGAKDALYHSQKTVARMEILLPHLESRLLPEAGHVLIGLTSLTMPFLASGCFIRN